MRRGEDAHVDRGFARLADGPHGFLLDGAQQLDLHVQRQVGDLVEERGAAVGRREETGLVADGAGEAAAPVTEQLALDQLVGMAPQFTGTNGRSARGPVAWITRATSSLPVPDSPEMCTGPGCAPRLLIISRNRSIGGPLP